MEMLAEAAAFLVPGQRLIGMRDIRAYRWIALDKETLVLDLIARRNLSVPDQVHVQIFEAADGHGRPAAAPTLEGTMLFGEDYPEPPVVGEFILRGERPSKWNSEQLYREGTFHGPAFRGVVSMDRWGEDGAEATLEVLPLELVYPQVRSEADQGNKKIGALLTDPVLLDQPGQVLAFWMAEHFEQGYVIFPFRLKALHLYGPPLPPHEQVKCRARIALVGNWQVQSDLDVVCEDGRVWARFIGWEDRRFDLPKPFLRFMLSPQDRELSEPWLTPVTLLPATEGILAYRLSLKSFPEDFFTAHSGLWGRVLAHLVLSKRERGLWRSLKTPESRRIEWLLGRVVAKDAVREFLRRYYGLILCPADIEILPDEHGRPIAQGAWVSKIPSVPFLSLAHSGGVAVAVVGDSRATGVGVDIEHRNGLPEEVKQLAFTPEEQTLLGSVAETGADDWPLRLWCAKEAAAKAAGQGFVSGPQACVVKGLNPETGAVQVELAGERARQGFGEDSLTLTAFTAREEELVIAVCSGG